MSILVDVGRSLREGFFMFWETLWALVLGFGLSGAVQAFVSRNEMERLMGDHRPKTVARASLLGMASSSCSYAASAMAKSLFQKGADFLSSMVFMFASTNLVVELGVVLVILMGWQFAAAEFVGGPIMIVLLVAAGGVVLSRPMIEAARARVRTATPGAHEHGATDRVQQLPWREKLRSKGGWSGAASYTMADLTMLRKELVIGYAVAGFLAVLVPTTVWNAVFLHGHGALTSLENAIVGPFIAVISFVCSIGNVPMATALWHGGISFGGVVSFVFADLIALPLVAIYRKLYGTPLTIRMFVLFYAVMAAAGLVVEGIFGAAGLIPKTRPSMIVATSFHWNYTTGLNFVFLLVFAALYWMYRNRDRFGAHERYSIDPVCGMQVEKANAPASLMFESRRVLFCSDRCKERFSSNPAKFASAPAGEHADHFMPH